MQGTLKASKGRQGEHAANHVHVLIGILRLPHVKSDVVLTLATPTEINAASAAADEAGAGAKTLHLTAPELFQRMLQTFRVVDWELFGES